MRNYSNVAEETSLSTGINSSDTSITVGSNTGYPTVPYTIILDPGLATEEVCEVTAVAGTTWTITRGVDGTPATSHDLGAVVVHGYSARDLRDIQDHIADTTGVHGIGASSLVVGTTDTQTLTNKTLTTPTITGGTIGAATLTTPTIADFSLAQHDHSNAAGGGSIGGGGGGTASGHKRTGTGNFTTNGNSDVTNGAAVGLETAVYSFGAGTWTVAESSRRLIIPATLGGAHWHVTAEARVPSDKHNVWVIIWHETLGAIATGLSSQDSTFGLDIHVMSASTDFTSAAGQWLEVRIGLETALVNVPYTATLAIHKID